MVDYDVVIIGGGVTGTADAAMIAKYTGLERIALFEKYFAVAQVNSSAQNNSQTLHRGDIESNYSPEKAAKVRREADMILDYLANEPQRDEIMAIYDKMLLAVGDREVAELAARHAAIKHLYPRAELIDRERIEMLEPHVMQGRDPTQAMSALYTSDGYTVDYERLSQSFARNAQGTGKEFDLYLGSGVGRIARSKEGFVLETEAGELSARAVLVCAGAHSLQFAKSLGYGMEYAILPVVGSFFYARGHTLNGKVYTMQNPKLPFAAVHGDPDVHDPEVTRFGPTAKVVPLLERGHYASLGAFLRTTSWTADTIASYWSILKDPTMHLYIARNGLYEMPFGLGKKLFAHDIRKIIPAITADELDFSKATGGLRPQLVDTKKHALLMGEARIIGEGEPILFNTTPSPGATVCVANGVRDARVVAQWLGATVDEAALKRDFPNTYEP